MRELRLTDAELQAIIAPALRERLKKAGFRMGPPADDMVPAAYFFPINLNLTGDVDIERTADGVWTIRQDDFSLLMHDLQHEHYEAISAREAPRRP